jgi:kanamycin nucleotidyltransferase
MPGGPQPRERTERLQLAQEIAARALELHGERVLAIGLYGSTARGTDGPFSDIEMFCILNTSDEDYSHEWSYGPWKAEVDFLSENVVLSKAAEIDERWSLTHSVFCNVHALYDPHNFFARLCEVVTSQPQERFTAVIHALIVDEIYEAIGKLRNAQYQGNMAYLPEVSFSLAKYGAFLVGLANRYHYSTGSGVQAESLTLPGRPAGYDELCEMVMKGELNDPVRIVEACEAFWAGVEQWAEMRGIRIDVAQKIPF